MPDKLDNLKRLKSLLEVANEDRPSTKEVVGMFKALTNVIKDAKSQVARDLAQSKGEMSKELSSTLKELKTLEKRITSQIRGVEKQVSRAEQRFLSDSEETVKLLLANIRRIENKQVDFSGVRAEIQEVRNLIPEVPKVPDAKKLDEELEKRLNKKIKDLEGRTEKGFSNIPRGGGVSALGVRQAFKLIFHTEAPSGDIDGANTEYTVENDIWAIIGFTLNGEQIAELPNYTFARKTITFSSALPAAYSGLDFEVKYIG